MSRTQALDLIRLDYLDRSCEEDLNSRRPDVVCLWRPFAGTGAHCSTAGATGRTDCEIFARNELQTLVERAHVSRDGECSYRSSGRSRPVFSPQERFDPQPRIRTTPNAA